MDGLTIVKKQLFESLGTNQNNYIKLLRLFISGLINKEEFDYRVSSYLSSNQITLHNQFILRLFQRCHENEPHKSATVQSRSPTKSADGVKTKAQQKQHLDPNQRPAPLAAKKKRLKLNKAAFDHRFVKPHISEYLQPSTKSVADLNNQAQLLKVKFIETDGAVPDTYSLHVRTLLCCWESGMDGTTDETIELLNLAIRHYVKNILSTLFNFKSNHRITGDSRHNQFRYGYGLPAINPYLINSHSKSALPLHSAPTYTNDQGEQLPLITTVEMAEQQAMFELACSTTNGPLIGRRHRLGIDGTDRPKEPINLWHMFHAFRIYSKSIPSHALYSIYQERILNRLSSDYAAFIDGTVATAAGNGLHFDKALVKQEDSEDDEDEESPTPGPSQPHQPVVDQSMNIDLEELLQQ